MIIIKLNTTLKPSLHFFTAGADQALNNPVLIDFGYFKASHLISDIIS